METITLNKKVVYEKGKTTKYWRYVECEPQEVELKTWANNNPLFILKGKVINSHDSSELGKTMEVYVQTYSFWLEPLINEGIYTIKN